MERRRKYDRRKSLTMSIEGFSIMKDKGMLFDIQKFSLNDGEGIRTVVFFKGCPLRCEWCANPESQNIRPEVLLVEDRCINCGRCAELCSSGARKDGKWNREMCTNCMECVEGCLTDALEGKGRLFTVGEIVDEVEKDRVFYESSGGGITLSGGEPLLQYEFAAMLAAECKKRNIDVAMETTGYAKWEQFYAVAQYCNHLLFDIKHIDAEKHFKHTGVHNESIIENLKKAAKLGKDIVVRVPLIGGVNDDKDTIHEIVHLAAENDIERLDLLPYHRLGESKYKSLGRAYHCDAYTPAAAAVEDLKTIALEHGLIVRVGG